MVLNNNILLLQHIEVRNRAVYNNLAIIMFQVQTLTDENQMLREEVKKLSNEVKTLKNLLSNINGFPNIQSTTTGATASGNT